MKYPKLRELKYAIKALIKGPYTTKFPFKPHKPFESFRGKPEFNEKDCIGCTACVQVCPAKALSFEDVNGTRKLTIRWDTCIGCGQCQANCPAVTGIVLSNEFDLSTTEKREELAQTIEKELVLCDCCQDVVGPYDQMIWVAKRIGPLCYSNATLMYFYLRDFRLALSQKPLPKEIMEFERSDRIKILCPRCRRQAIYSS